VAVSSAIVPVAKAKGKGGINAIRKKILDSLGEKPVEEAMTEAKSVLQKADATIEEAKALEDAQNGQVEAAQKEFDDAKEHVAKAIENEAATAARWNELKSKKDEAHAKVDSKRGELLEAQKRLAMLEVVALNHARMAELEGKRKAATEAAEAAKRHLLEQRQKEKEALEKTKQALMELRGQPGGKGRKRAAEDEAAAQNDPTKVADRKAATPQASISSMPTVVDTVADIE